VTKIEEPELQPKTDEIEQFSHQTQRCRKSRTILHLAKEIVKDFLRERMKNFSPATR
jgi:hypothetical protein